MNDLTGNGHLSRQLLLSRITTESARDVVENVACASSGELATREHGLNLWCCSNHYIFSP